MKIAEILGQKRRDILRIAAKYGARKVSVFGSVARGEDRENSDIDILVELEPGRSLLDLGALWSELNELLNCPVEVFTAMSLRENVRERALLEAVPI
ncbi:MAG: nucleotidyltransferase family protein [Candidatus Coatesbacteria bacterium]|nr:nucleotidyltransferase family protein [Candidatus Coatesbacteria bacterium]